MPVKKKVKSKNLKTEVPEEGEKLEETKEANKEQEESEKLDEVTNNPLNDVVSTLHAKMGHLSDQIDDMETQNRELKTNKGAFNILTPVYRIRYDGSFNKAKAQIVDDSIKIGKRKYMITSNPLRMTNKFGYSKLMYFISDETGSTIDFDLLQANKAQFDATTHALWFDKTALQNALSTQKSNPINSIAFLAIGVVLGIFITASGLLGV